MKKRFNKWLTAFLITTLLASCVGVLPASAATPAGAKTTLTLANAGEPLLFYHLSSKGCNSDDNLVLSNVYDCLTFLEADGSISPGIAEKWEISEDGLRYTFHIREGVKFHDGSELTVEDVAFTLNQGKAGPLGNALLINFERCEIVDEHTIDIYLTSPYAAFLYGLASRVGGIVSKAYYDKVGEEGYMKAPIGTGPYKFVSAISGDQTALEAFADYWRGTPPIQTIYLKTMTDTSTQIIALENGDVDAVRNPSIASCMKLDTAKGVTWVKGDSVGRITLYLAEWGDSPCADVNVRKAIQSAINKKDINIGVNEGYATILDIDMCPIYGGYPTDFKVVPYDVEKAKEYLAASSYNGEEISLVVRVGTTMETAARIIQAQLMDIGINCTVNAVDNATYTELYAGANYDGLVLDNPSSLVDADGFLPIFNLPETGYVFAQHNNYQRKKEIYDLCMLGRAAVGDARLDIYRQAVDIATDEAYLVPLYNGINTVAHRDDLGGVAAHCLGTYNFYQWHWQ